MDYQTTYEIRGEPIVLFESTVQRLTAKYGQKIGWELIVLYLFYYRTAKYQETKQVKATVKFVANGLGWASSRVRSRRQQLIAEGMIEDIRRTDECGKVTGWFVHVRVGDIAVNTNHPPKNRQCGELGGKILKTKKRSNREKTQKKKRVRRSPKNKYEEYARAHMEKQKESHPTRIAKPTRSMIEKSADALRKCVELDGIEWSAVTGAIDWARDDDFWCDKIFSLAQIRKTSQSNGLKKIENIINSRGTNCRQSQTSKSKLTIKKSSPISPLVGVLGSERLSDGDMKKLLLEEKAYANFWNDLPGKSGRDTFDTPQKKTGALRKDRSNACKSVKYVYKTQAKFIEQYAAWLNENYGSFTGELPVSSLLVGGVAWKKFIAAQQRLTGINFKNGEPIH